MLLALLLFVLCAPAHATTYWVATNGNSAYTGRDSSGGSPNGPKSSAWLATATLQPGDLVRFTHQSFRGYIIDPASSGTAANPITIYGDSLYPSSVTTGGINFHQNSGSRYIRLIGFRVLTLNCTTALGTTSGHGNGYQGIISTQHVFVGRCVFDSLFVNNDGASSGIYYIFGDGGHYSHYYACTFGSATVKALRPDRLAIDSKIDGHCGPFPDAIVQDTMSFCTLNIEHFNCCAGGALIFRQTETCQFYGNTFNVTVQLGGAQGLAKFYGNQHSSWHDNTFNYRSFNTAYGDEDGMTYIRDYTQFCTWERDTFNTLGSGAIQFYIVNSGSCPGSNRCNVWDHCVWYDSSGVRTGGEGRVEWHDTSHAITFTNNVVVSRNAIPMTNTTGGGCDSCDIEHNTFVAIGATSALDMTVHSATTEIVRNNILYAPAAASYILRRATGPKYDYNLFYGPDSTKAENLSGTNYTITQRCTGAAQECNSLFSDPLLIGGATYSNSYDARLRPASPARHVAYQLMAQVNSCGATPTGEDIGAYQFGDPLPRVYQYWVSPTARGVHPGVEDGAHDGSDSTKAITLRHANEIAEPGARFILLGGDYTADASHTEYLCGTGCTNASLTAENGNAIAPITAGMSFDSTLAVTYCSAWYYTNAIAHTVTSAPDTNSFRVSGITITQPYVKVQGITCGALTAYSATSDGVTCAATITPANAWCFHAQNDSVTWCKATTLQLGGCDQVYLNNCWVVTPRLAGTTGQTAARNAIYGAYNSLANLPGCTSVALTDCYLGMYLDWGQAGLQVGAHTNGATFTRCTMNCELQPAAQPSTATDTLHFVELRDCYNVAFTDCHWRVNCTAGETVPLTAPTDSLNAMALVLKDGAQFVTFLRDTLDLGYRSYNKAVIQLVAKGGLRPAVNNVAWQDCIVRGDWVLSQQVRCSQWGWLGCALGTRRLGAFYAGQFGSTDLASDTLTVDHCTLYSDGAAPALTMNLPGTVKKVQLTRNIYFRRTTAVATTGAICNYAACIGAAPAFKADENIYWSNTDSLQNAAFVTGWARTGVGPDSLYNYGTFPQIPKLSDYTGPPEQFSLYGNPSLVATSVDSTFDGSLNCLSAAYRSRVPQHYYSHGDSAAGAYQPGDIILPGTCTAVTADITLTTPTTLTITFTGGANNGTTGVGTPSGYDLYYSTSAINIVDDPRALALASVVTVTGAAPGTTVSKQLTSLANSTIYFFAVKTRGRCNTQGTLSAVGCSATHTAADAVSPHLCDQ